MAAGGGTLGARARASLRSLLVSAGVFGEVFRVPDLRRTQLAFIGFNMTEWAASVAILVYAFQRNGAGAAGLIAAIQLIPAALVAPFAAVLGDRIRRELMLRFAYAVQALTTGLTATALLLDAPLAVVYALASLTAIGLTLVRPVHDALVPALARSPAQLTAGYVAGSVIETASAMLGPLLAGLVMAVSEPGMVYAVLSVWLGVSTVLALRIRTRTEPASSGEEAHVIAEALAGFEALRADRRPRLIVALLGTATLTAGFLDVLIVVLGFDLFASGEAGTGLLGAALGAGALVGSLATVVLIARRRLHGAMLNGMLLCGGPIALLAAAPSAGLAAATLAVSGAGWSAADVTGRTMLQRLVPDEALSRVLGVLEGTYMATQGIGAVVAGVLVSTLGTDWTLLVSGLLLPVLALLVRGRLAAADVGPSVPEDHLRLLHFLPLFAPLDAPDLERVAQHVVAVEASSGEVVIAEGTVGDRFYAIRSGEVAVTREGRELATLGAGEYFGEIALLRDVPRTATVTALTGLELLALERAPFLEAVTGHPESSLAVNRVADERLDTHEA